MNKGSCSTCGFGVPEGQGIRCKRHPPTVLAVPTSQRWQEDRGETATFEQLHPWMQRDDWCGEYRGKLSGRTLWP